MNHDRNSLFVLLVLLSSGVLVFTLFLSSIARPMNYADLRTVLTTTTATFGSLLGIITAGLMFTHGKFSELASELSEKSPDYLSGSLSLEEAEKIGTRLLTLRKTFSRLETESHITEERNLYRRIIESVSSIFVDIAVLLNLKLQQQGMRDIGLLISEMDPPLHSRYQEARGAIRKEWQILEIIRNIVDTWEGSLTFAVGRPETRTSLRSDLKSSVTILELKEKIDENSKSIRGEAAKALGDLSDDFSRIGEQLHRDRIPQLLLQMEHAAAIRGKYFYLTLVFIATPLFVNLIILPQLSEGTAQFYQPFVSATSSLSVMGVIFLLLYIRKILNV